MGKKLVPNTRLTAARMALEWSQNHLALESGVSQGYICRIEQGRIVRVTVVEAAKLVAAVCKAGGTLSLADFVPEALRKTIEKYS